jgi:hypothetical protein
MYAEALSATYLMLLLRGLCAPEVGYVSRLVENSVAIFVDARQLYKIWTAEQEVSTLGMRL